MYRVIVSVFILTMLSACSNKDLYSYGQNHQKMDCINNAQTEKQISDCHTNKGKSFDEYSNERDELTEKESNN